MERVEVGLLVTAASVLVAGVGMTLSGPDRPSPRVDDVVQELLILPDGTEQPPTADRTPVPEAEPSPTEPDDADGAPDDQAASSPDDEPADGAPDGTARPGPEPSPTPARDRSAPEPTPAPERQEPGLRELAAEGVYTYTTSGFHEAATVAGTQRNDYPSTTTITLRHTPCGIAGRWAVSDERWEDAESCRDGRSLELRRLRSFHEFYGRGQERTSVCDPAPVTYPDHERVGATWSGRCTADDTDIEVRAEFVGLETVRVGEERLEAVRISVTSTLTGGMEGRQRVDRWLQRGTGLELRAVGQLETRGGSGLERFTLRERYERHLTATTPRS